MKASLKFRDEQTPIFRAKIPLNIMGFPFQSSLTSSASNSKDLCLTLGTFFDSGPAFRVSYRPNDAIHPFTLTLKTGIGHFGSPTDAPLTMSAEFNLVGGGKSNPSFVLHFKPRFGDFSVKKTQDSAFRNGDLFEEDSSVEFVEKPEREREREFTSLPFRSSVAGVIENAVSGMEVAARTFLPIRNAAVFSFRWGVKLNNSTAEISSWRIPYLVMNKIGIEHVARKERDEVGPILGIRGSDVDEGDVAVMTWKRVKGELEGVKRENGELREAVEELRVEFAKKGLKSLEIAGKYKEGGTKMQNLGERKSTEMEGNAEVKSSNGA